jgi:hypothetical protein
LFREALKNTSPFPNVKFNFVKEAGTDVSALTGAKDVNPETVYILSAQDKNYTGGRYIPTTNLPRLALSVYSYTQYKHGDEVLANLVDLFSHLRQIDMNNNLSLQIMTELIAAIQA